MHSYDENTDLSSIIRACLNLIQSKRPDLKRTKSQTVATSELWFIEVDLKKITSLPEFLSWVKERFSPQFNLHRNDNNKHVAKMFNAIADEILKQVQQSQNVDIENQQLIANLLGRADLKKSLERTLTPVLTVPLDNDEMDNEEHWSDTLQSLTKQ